MQDQQAIDDLRERAQAALIEFGVKLERIAVGSGAAFDVDVSMRAGGETLELSLAARDPTSN